jgi:RNA polymerase sigma-70 factor (sigma-E family)
VAGDDRLLSADEEYSAYVGARWSTLIRAARLLGCSADEAEDVVQAALVKCYVSWSKVSTADDRDGYVYRVLLNTRRSLLRKARSTQSLSGAKEPEPRNGSNDYDAVDLTESVERALSSLTPNARQVVVLRFFVDLSEKQTADVLGVATGTVKSRLSRALAQLSKDPHLADVPGWSTR